MHLVCPSRAPCVPVCAPRVSHMRLECTLRDFCAFIARTLCVDVCTSCVSRAYLMYTSCARCMNLVCTPRSQSVRIFACQRVYLYMYHGCLMYDMCVASCRPHIAHVAQSRVHLMSIPCANRVRPARTSRRLACQRVPFVCLMCALLPPVLRADLRHAPTCV